MLFACFHGDCDWSYCMASGLSVLGCGPGFFVRVEGVTLDKRLTCCVEFSFLKSSVSSRDQDDSFVDLWKVRSPNPSTICRRWKTGARKEGPDASAAATVSQVRLLTSSDQKQIKVYQCYFTSRINRIVLNLPLFISPLYLRLSVHRWMDGCTSKAFHDFFETVQKTGRK